MYSALDSNVYLRLGFLFITVLLIFTLSCVREDDLTLEQQAHLLDRQLMCPICDGQTLDQSQAQISKDMRGVIRYKLQAGESSEEIKAYFVSRYGQEVLAAPSGGGLNTLAWVMPAVISLLGIVAVGFAFFNMKAKVTPDSVPVKTTDDIDMEKYLRIVEQETNQLNLVNEPQYQLKSEKTSKDVVDKAPNL